MNPFEQTILKRLNDMLCVSSGGRGYTRWWHSFSGTCAETGERRTFFVEYYIRHSSHAAVKAGVFPDENNSGDQFLVTYPIFSLKLVKEPLVLQMEDCFYSDTHIYGCAKMMNWDLEVHKTTACSGRFWSRPAASLLRLLENFWHGEGIHTFYRGQISYGGQVYDVTPENCYGYADRHWGRSASLPMLQLNACRLVSSRKESELKHSALAIHDCQPRFLFFPLKRRLMIHLTYMGEDFEFGLLNPNPFFRCKWLKKETNKRHIWHIAAQNKAAVVKISYSSPKDGIMNLNRKHPILSGANGTGTIELFRLTPEGRQHLDTLSFRDGFWAWREDVQETAPLPASYLNGITPPL